MTAFSATYSGMVSSAIRTLRNRMLYGNRLELTHAEFLALFATPEEIGILEQAMQVADVHGYTGYASGEYRHPALKELTGEDAVQLSFNLRSTDGSPAPLRPRNKIIRSDADPELLDRITPWVIERIEVGYAFSKADRLFDWLNFNCSSKDQLRFLWPSVIPLLALCEEGKEMADRLREVKAPKHMPRISPAVRQLCRESAGIIAAAGLLDKEAHYSVAPCQVDVDRAPSIKTEVGYISA